MTPVMKERLQRVIGLPKRPLERSTGLKLALLCGVLLLIGLMVLLADRSPNLSHLRVSMLSASERGNYYAIVQTLAAEAARQKGQIINVPSAGSVDNIARLGAAQKSCEVQFALVQDGIGWPADVPFELIGRLSKPESFVLLGRDADRIKALTDLRGARIGVGPVGSGTERVARQILEPLQELGITLVTQPMDEQLAKLERSELDLGAMVIDEDARIITEAVRDRHLQILNIPHAEALSRRLPFTRLGRISTGQYDPIRLLPGEDKQVLRIDTLVVGNRCTRWSTTQALITVLAAVFPDFIQHNHDTPNRTGLPLAPAAQSYLSSQGPDIVGIYAPWVVDMMPTARWIQLLLGVSLLNNAMAWWHQFRLWRIDVNRLRLEGIIPRLFGTGVTVSEIAERTPSEQHRTPEVRAELDNVMQQLTALLERSRRQSQSILVPMGQEMSYRYQETLIADHLYALRAFRDRLGS